MYVLNLGMEGLIQAPNCKPTRFAPKQPHVELHFVTLYVIDVNMIK